MPTPDQKNGDHLALRLVWWNTESFFHFDAKKVKTERWPKSVIAYSAKCDRVDKALNVLIQSNATPTVLFLGEITSKAVTSLRDRILPSAHVISLDVMASRPTLQVAVIYPDKLQNILFEEQQPITIPRTTSDTRPIAVLDIFDSDKKSRIRCYVCHLTSRMDEKGSHQIRKRAMECLTEHVYDFINSGQVEKRSVVIIGDLNEEPYEQPSEVMNAHRHRSKSQRKKHRYDQQLKRTHLYNCSWRLLGEKYPHGPFAAPMHIAGTYYWAEKRSWHNFDNIIVSGGLVSDGTPYVDESTIEIVSFPEFLPSEIPQKFSYIEKVVSGLSDHLPVAATIILG